ncbi:hypothetical protein D3C75_919400 [compost metagenome]
MIFLGANRSAQIIRTAPATRPISTVEVENKYSSIESSNRKPSTPKGMRPTITCASFSRPVVSTAGWPSGTAVSSLRLKRFSPSRSMNRLRKITTTARIEPSWITTLKVFAVYFPRNSCDFSHISSTITIWPVEDTGANSVNPSTIPRMIALIIVSSSMNSPPKSFVSKALP